MFMWDFHLERGGTVRRVIRCGRLPNHLLLLLLFLVCLENSFLSFVIFLNRIAWCSNVVVHDWRAVEQRRGGWRLRNQSPVPYEPVGDRSSRLGWNGRLSIQRTSQLLVVPETWEELHDLPGCLLDGSERRELHHHFQQLPSSQLKI